MTDKSLPDFFNYKSGGKDTGFETLQDFWLAWTIRCSEERYADIDHQVYVRSRLIVYMLIHGTNDNNGNYEYSVDVPSEFKVVSANTFRQFKLIDLIADLQIQDETSQYQALINIENKWYTSTTTSQLQNANKNIKLSKSWSSNSKLFNRLIYCDECNQSIKTSEQICRNNNFAWLSIEKLKTFLHKVYPSQSGNKLFDTYWY